MYVTCTFYAPLGIEQNKKNSIMKTTGELIELLKIEIDEYGIGIYTEKRKVIEEMLSMKGVNPSAIINQILQPDKFRNTVNRQDAKTAEQEIIEYQIKAGFGFYGLRYKNATTQEEKNAIIKSAL